MTLLVAAGLAGFLMLATIVVGIGRYYGLSSPPPVDLIFVVGLSHQSLLLRDVPRVLRAQYGASRREME